MPFHTKFYGHHIICKYIVGMYVLMCIQFKGTPDQVPEFILIDEYDIGFYNELRYVKYIT